MQMTLHHIGEALASSGLLALGAFQPKPSDEVPGGTDASRLVLVGNAGTSMWRAFSNSGTDEETLHPLDHWTRQVLMDISNSLSSRFDVPVQALFPFDGPPYMPFQRWAVRSGAVHPSPIGPMIHGTFGLWHAYRGALVIESPVEFDVIRETSSPCQSCAEKPCLTTCPVGAFSSRGYDVPACLDLLQKDPEGECFSASCLARRACPIGREYIYEGPQARFHMAKFLSAHRPKQI